MFGMIRGGFLSEEDRNKLIALAREGSVASRVTRRANALVLLDDGWSCQEVADAFLLNDDPPPTGKGTPIVTRLQPRQLTALDAWIAKQREPVSRPEAIRRLIEAGLRAKPTLPLYTKKHAAKAAKIAERHIDPLINQSATSEERHSRKRRLLKGPEEFREMRSDIPKAKRRR